jgi:TatD DNase family protein
LSFGDALLYDPLLQKLAAGAPFDRIFLETDGAEVSINDLYQTLATIKSLPLPAVIDQLYTNFRTTFRDGKLA